MVIDGKSVTSENKFEVINPASGTQFAECVLGKTQCNSCLCQRD